MQYHHWAALAVVSGIVPATGWAAASTDEPVAPTTAILNEIVVTPTRTPQTMDHTLAATSVITRADIERSQAQNVMDLLERTPSVSITNSGGPGKKSSIHLRGTGTNQVLVLVDGMRYGSVTDGAAAIAQLPVSEIKRIEIVRGPRSSLYGADAVGGVIQIFTRNGKGLEGQGPSPYFSVTAGSHNTWKGQGGVSGATKRFNYNFSISGDTTRGINACNGVPFAGGCFADQPDKDGYHRVDGSMNVGYRFDSGVQIKAHYMRVQGKSEYDAPNPNPPYDAPQVADVYTDIVQEIYGFSIDAPLTDIWHSRLSFGRSRDLSDNYYEGDATGHFDSHQTTVTWENDIDFAPGQHGVLGVDFRQDQLASTNDYSENKRNNTGGFAEYLGRFGAHEIDLAGRVDRNEAYGTHATGSINYGYHLSQVYTLTASYGNAFRAPTFNDLYYPNTLGLPPISNPDLKPEKSRTGELGLKAAPDWGRWAIHAYQTDIRDAIALDDNYTPHNLAKVRIRGIEGEVTTYFGPWRVGASANWLHARNRTPGSNYNNDVTYRPRYGASLDIDRNLFSRYSVGGSARLVGSRYTNDANTEKLGGYALFDLRGEMRIDDRWKLQAQIRNLLDKRYETMRYYNQPGRTFYVTLRYQPDMM